MRIVTCLAGLTLLLFASGCSSSVRASATLDEDVAWSDYARVLVESRNGSVAIEHVPGEQVRISGEKWARGADVEEAEQRLERVRLVAGPQNGSPDTLEIRVEADESAGRQYGAKLQIAVPVQCAVEVRTSNGGVRVAEMNAADVETSNGSVVLRKISGDAAAKSSNGGLTFEDLQGNCRGKTSNGSITLRNVQGVIDARTTNGRINATALGSESRDVVLHSSNGSVTAELPATMSAVVDANTSNGKISVEAANVTWAEQKVSKRSYHARLNGGEDKVEVRTSNGSIRLKFK